MRGRGLWQDRRMWRRARRIAGALPLPDPFDPAELVALLAERRGRAIELLPVAGRASVPCGLLATTDRVDYILYAADTTDLHRQHIILHEVAHLLCGHAGGGADPAAVGAVLTPRLSPELVRRVLGRTVYTEPQEREAEVLASLILHRAIRSGGASGARGATGSRLDPLVGAPAPRR